MRHAILYILAILFADSLTPAAAELRHWRPPDRAGKWGHYEGEIVARFLSDGRVMKLELPFRYIGPEGRPWPVPAGAATDGASVPQALWFAFPPYSGPYRGAAVMHDHYCAIKTRPWKETHRAFYTALRAAGVRSGTAKAMYLAVLRLGPRWPPPGPEPPAPRLEPRPAPRPPVVTGSIPKPVPQPRVKLSKPKPALKPPRKAPIIKVKTKPAAPWESLFPKRAPAWSPHRRTDHY